MSIKRRCQAPGCEVLFDITTARGRPRLYCSAACRPSRRSRSAPAEITVEVVADTSSDVPPSATRHFTVRLRRAEKTVVVANDVGRFSAALLAEDLRLLLT